MVYYLYKVLQGDAPPSYLLYTILTENGNPFRTPLIKKVSLPYTFITGPH